MPKLRPLVVLLFAAVLSVLALSGPAGAIDNPDYASVPPKTPTQNSVPPSSTPPSSTPPSSTPPSSTPPSSTPPGETPPGETPPSGTSSGTSTQDPTGYTVTGVVSRTASTPQTSSATIADPAEPIGHGTTIAAASSESLAYTGADTIALVAAGAGLVVLGGLVVMVRRRAFA